MSISLVESVEDNMLSSPSQSSSSQEEGDFLPNDSKIISSLQTDSGPVSEEKAIAVSSPLSASVCSCCLAQKSNCTSGSNPTAISDLTAVSTNCKNPVLNAPPIDPSSVNIGKCTSTSPHHNQTVSAFSNQTSSSLSWNQLHKSKSPKIKCQLQGVPFLTLIDSGAEINAVDKDFADSLHIGIVSTRESAKAANQLPLEICGQTALPISIECTTEMGPVLLHLGVVLVIANLGISCLLGEPGKKLNNIICLPRHKLVVIASGESVHYTQYADTSDKYSLIRAVSTQTLAPGDFLSYKLPDQLCYKPFVNIIPRSLSLDWLQPYSASRTWSC